MPDQPVLQTPRLVLRPAEDADAPALLDYLRLESVTKWLGDPTPWPDLDHARARIASWHARPAPLGTWVVAPREGDGTAVGTVSCQQLRCGEEVEIGWTQHPAHSGNGYAAEAAAALLAHLHAQGIGTVWAVMWPDNGPSAALARRIGMREVGVRADPWYGTAEDPDSRIFRADDPPLDPASASADDVARLTAAVRRLAETSDLGG